jgi:hypothetical protein
VPSITAVGAALTGLYLLTGTADDRDLAALLGACALFLK